MPKRFQIILTEEAEQNIEEAYHWIEQSDPIAASRWYDGLMDALQSLSIMPVRCSLSPESRLGFVSYEVRQLLYGKGFWKYRILFMVESHRVVIVHIRHGARLYLGEESQEEEE